MPGTKCYNSELEFDSNYDCNDIGGNASIDVSILTPDMSVPVRSVANIDIPSSSRLNN